MVGLADLDGKICQTLTAGRQIAKVKFFAQSASVASNGSNRWQEAFA